MYRYAYRRRIFQFRDRLLLGVIHLRMQMMYDDGFAYQTVIFLPGDVLLFRFLYTRRHFDR